MKVDQLKKQVNTHLERLDKKATLTSVTISEIRSQLHRMEHTMEDHLGRIPEPDNPSWVFLGDIVHLDTPDDYTNDVTPPTRRRHREERLPHNEEIRRNNGNIPHGLSPVREYVPAGA